MGQAAQLTYAGIALAVFAQQFCLPVPSMLLLIAAGTLAAEGHGSLHLPLVLAAAIAGCLAADGFWFWLGRRWGSGVIRVVCSFTANPKTSRERSRRVFSRWGLHLLLVAKFIPGLDGVSPPLAGAEGASVQGFLLYDTAGSLLWCGAYVLLGFLFANQLDGAMHRMEQFSRALLILVGVPLACYAGWRGVQLVRVIRHLRLRRISPALLAEKMLDLRKVAVFDLLYFEAEERMIPGIPGAVRVDPNKLQTAPKATIPTGLDVVLYCSSQNEFVSARVAQAMEKRGIAEVWVLEGGLEAWVLEGRPVTLDMPTGEQVAERVGIVLPPEML
jgi:membrane protein DedA with SNARE-associated domain/rhodanese-related sulfurtransferase